MRAMIAVVQAISSAVRPIVTVNTNIASSPYDSSTATVSLLLSTKVMPPEIRQNAVMSSVGGRDGRKEVGGEMYRVMYVNPRARAKPMNMLPHWPCIIVDSIES